MKHEYRDNIICPYCEYEDKDSLEFDEESGNYTCGECGKEFYVERHISISYSSSIIDCEEKGKVHDYQFNGVHLMDRELINGVWLHLKEENYKYYKLHTCTICEDTVFTQITENEYNELKDVK